jgi:hypothetical protein
MPNRYASTRVEMITKIRAESSKLNAESKKDLTIFFFEP